MLRLFLRLAILFAFDIFKCDAQSFTRCGLVWELRRQGFPEDKMRDWVCLIEHESGRNVKKIGPMNKDGSYDYGLFQINDYYWCNRGNIPGKRCSVTCDELLSFVITKACDCAKIIYNSQGFLAWYKWRNYCQNPEDLPDISSCN